METLHRGIALSICLAAAPLLAQTGTTAKPSDAKDTITFSNGDTLTGKVGKVTYGNLSFHSDELAT